MRNNKRMIILICIMDADTLFNLGGPGVGVTGVIYRALMYMDL